jgi:hypothetical protein
MLQREVNTENKIVTCRLNDTGNCPFLGFVLLGKQKNEPGFGMESRLNKSLSEYRESGTPGDCTGASFLVLFCGKKVQLALGAKPRWVWIVSKSPVKNNICYTNHLIQNTRTTHNKRKDK